MSYNLGKKKQQPALSIDDFIGNSGTSDEGNVKSMEIPIQKIKSYPNQPFAMYEKSKMEELKQSIKQNGLLQDIIVRKIDENDYQVLAGHNRLEACKELGFAKISCVVKINLSDAEARLIMVDTNLCQRQNLTLAEKAMSYKIQKEALLELGAKNSTQMMADKYSETTRTIQYYIKAAELPEELFEVFSKGRIALNATAAIVNLSKDEQTVLTSVLDNTKNKKIDRSVGKAIASAKKETDNITEETFKGIIETKNNTANMSIKIPTSTYNSISDVLSKKELEKYIIYVLQNKENVIKFVNENCTNNVPFEEPNTVKEETEL